MAPPSPFQTIPSAHMQTVLPGAQGRLPPPAVDRRRQSSGPGRRATSSGGRALPRYEPLQSAEPVRGGPFSSFAEPAAASPGPGRTWLLPCLGIGVVVVLCVGCAAAFFARSRAVGGPIGTFRELVLAKTTSSAPEATSLAPVAPVAVVAATSTTTAQAHEYDCNIEFANWRHGWSYSKKDWCCRNFDRGCPGSPTQAPFDCSIGFIKAWTPLKRRWCCEHEHLGCPPTTTTSTATTSTFNQTDTSEKKASHKASESFDCESGFAHRAQEWSKLKQRWCCEHKKLGCPAQSTLRPRSTTRERTSPRPQPSSTRHAPSKAPAPTTTPATTTRQTSTREATATLTSSTAVAATTTARTEGCDKICKFENRLASCRKRVAYSVKHQFPGKDDACAKAHKLLLDQCPICSDCPLADLRLRNDRCRAEHSSEGEGSSGTESSTKEERAASARAPETSTRASEVRKPAAHDKAELRPTTACKRLCSMDNRSTSCFEHVRRATKKLQPIRRHAVRSPCLVAHDLVLQQCPTCGECTAAGAGCGHAAGLRGTKRLEG
mmetsp:Transcript_18125/g.52807  ORF Transcript_18125/g.52807 Transcript_18125/m.52807 type:complete len:549 (-) Transcript_18125:55-1701(-)